ncbi:alpha/beta hydrolase [Candidatus Babela massiliensis]|uniref:Alpha/beta superfamily hydrolase n=1 Tax=Candidatus Babela massiliensis TaxID=673862 RepID=V6DI69_9BACT|nr:alpha/beta hydrolase [Candidatus Babela massiliensis]CDK30226.1 alpha/beta superfamily hydrolase [Candidatus Babela massiliensis]
MKLRIISLLALVIVVYKEIYLLSIKDLNSIEEKVQFLSRENVDSDNKILRNGIIVKRPRAKATILICHGFMCDKFDISFLHVIFKDYNTMAFDFRAHGQDAKDQCCTFGRNEAYDILGAVKFIKNDPDLKNLPIIIYGFSMGAVASIIAGSIEKDLCNAMILDCPFESSDKLLERSLGKIKFSIFGYEIGMPGSNILKSYAYSPYVQSAIKTILKSLANIDSTQINTYMQPIYPEEAIKYIKKPVFIIGCTNDDKAPEEAVRSIYNGAKGFKRLWICNARRHFDPIFFKMSEYIKKVNKFIKLCLSDNINSKKPAKIKVDL